MNNETYSNLWGSSIEYMGIKFYPLKVDEYSYYQLMLQLLSYSKNSIADINVIHMSYLKFMLFMIQLKDDNGNVQNNLELLLKLLSYITKTKLTINNVRFKLRHNPPQSFDDYEDIQIIIGEKIINQTDFETIRQIILEQNGVSLKIINQYDPSLEEKLVYMQKGIEALDFDEEVFAFSIYMKLSLNEVKDYTFYQFKKSMERIQLKDQDDKFKPLEVSGQISFKDGSHIPSWLSHVAEKGRYDSILVSKDKFIKDNDFFKASANADNQDIKVN